MPTAKLPGWGAADWLRVCRLWGRVVLSLGLLVSSKLITIQVPFFFKSIVDQLNISQQVGGHGHDGDSPSSPCLLFRPYSKYPPVPTAVQPLHA